MSFALRALAQAASIRASQEFRLAEIVHANSSRAAVYGALACFGSRKKFVVHLRDLVDEASLGGPGFQLMTKIALRRADGVIGNSHATLESARPHIKSGCCVAVLASASGLQPRVGEFESGSLERVGMVARLDPWKGQALLLKAFATVFSSTAVRLLFAGSAPFGNEAYELELRSLAQRLGIAHQVDFLGHVEDVNALVETLDICVQASLRPEPLGQNVLQYLAQGRMTIAANAGGPAEWIKAGENGLLFELADECSLAEALKTAAEDPALRGRLASAAAATPGLLSDKEIAALHLAFFEKVGSNLSRCRADSLKSA